MFEKRRVRFATIEGIDRLDLPLAAEIWLGDVRTHPWMSSEALKLAALFTRYMSKPDPKLLELSSIDRSYQLDARQIRQALRLMQIYGFVEEFSLERNTLRVSINLSLLHRLRVLEARERFAELSGKNRPDVPCFIPTSDEKWLPKPGAADVAQSEDEAA